ncbi:MAG: methyltransferase domain-containing protein [Ignavibacterium sp.]|jgi:SAM-dependent methyltransferase|uniref:class I SAM-dependent methyltransferase n=1 Tax=Ignavibacterium sp. TaxID=2651167 RepID=UPI003299D593
MINHRKILYERYYSEFNSKISSINIKLLKSLYDHYDFKILPFLKLLSPDSKILELGCGPGYLLDYLKLKGFNKIKGIDISIEQNEIPQLLPAKIFNEIKSNYFTPASINTIDRDIFFLRKLVESFLNFFKMIKTVCDQDVWMYNFHCIVKK